MSRIVVVGGGHAAGQLCDSLRKEGFDGEISLICEEPRLPYQRPPLTKKFLTGELPEERLAFRPAALFEKLAIDARTGVRAERIDREARRVRLSDGSELDYQGLALATGARVKHLPIPGARLPGVHYIRRIEDVQRIREELDRSERIVIIGGGFVGLEAAASLRSLDRQVTVLEMQDRLMARAVAPVIGRFFEQVHRQAGVEIHLDACLRAVHGTERAKEVECVDGRTFPADLVIIGVGITPNTELAEAAGLGCEDGILVDDRARTEDPAIVAAGDCTRHPNPLIGGMVRLESVHNALEQAKTAAATLAGNERPYHQIPWFWSDQYQLKLQMAGISEGYDEHLIRGEMADGRFTALYFSEDRLIAVDTVNNPADHMAARKLLNARGKISLEAARADDFDLAQAARELPAT